MLLSATANTAHLLAQAFIAVVDGLLDAAEHGVEVRLVLLDLELGHQPWGGHPGEGRINLRASMKRR